jgi:hypothetical protein
MYGAHFVVDRMLDRVGIVAGRGRILNIDTGEYSKGYTQVNVMATSPNSRTKIHKAWFGGTSDIVEGSLIEDTAESKKYLVMSTKAEVSGEVVAFYDGTLYYANRTIDVLRQGAGTEDMFHRVTSDLTTVYSGIYAMVTPVRVDTVETDDQILDNNKIKIVVQATKLVHRNDRVLTSASETYKVTSVDGSSLDGLVIIYAETDIR